MTLLGSQSAQTGHGVKIQGVKIQGVKIQGVKIQGVKRQGAERCDEISTLRISECVRIEGMIHPHLSIYCDFYCLVNDLGGLS
jgi:hypothetical protein